ncbi:MAG: phosphatidate cytidylyltransferase, partial [Firmicutes bacterium]|nr:phosphatidate cytidylyltransferase [Bacillota bacterium]
MKIRIISSLIIAAVLAAIIPFRAFNVYAVDVIVVIFMFMAAIEMNNAFRAKLGVPYFLVVLLGVPLLYLAYLLGGLTFAGGLGAALTLVLFATVCLVLFTLKDPERALRARATAFILIYPLSLMLFLVALNHSDAEFGLDTVTPVALVFFISCVSDVMALLVGITLKGPKLAP